jgi:hypothetical protein
MSIEREKGGGASPRAPVATPVVLRAIVIRARRRVGRERRVGRKLLCADTQAEGAGSGEGAVDQVRRACVCSRFPSLLFAPLHAALCVHSFERWVPIGGCTQYITTLDLIRTCMCSHIPPHVRSEKILSALACVRTSHRTCAFHCARAPHSLVARAPHSLVSCASGLSCVLENLCIILQPSAHGPRNAAHAHGTQPTAHCPRITLIRRSPLRLS